MPQTLDHKPIRVAQSGARPLRAYRPEPLPPNPNHPPAPWILLLGAVCLAAALSACALWYRRGAHRAWKAFAASVGGEFKEVDGLSPYAVSGTIRGRPFLLETATSHEDDAGYYHTRGRVPIKNTGSVILGLRRKSLLEAAQTLREPPLFEMDDADFQRKFFIYCNEAECLSAVLTPDVRQELVRYNDIEIYVRMGEIEWRRAGEQADVRIVRRLTDMLVDMADVIDRFPSRGRTLTQLLADDKMIEKGL